MGDFPALLKHPVPAAHELPVLVPPSLPAQLAPTGPGVGGSGVQAITRLPLSQVKSQRWLDGQFWATTSHRTGMAPSGRGAPASAGREEPPEQAATRAGSRMAMRK